MGMAMVAEKTRALKIVAVCSKDIVKIVIGIYIICSVLFYQMLQNYAGYTN
jgi:hypothetical protein